MPRTARLFEKIQGEGECVGFSGLQMQVRNDQYFVVKGQLERSSLNDQ